MEVNLAQRDSPIAMAEMVGVRVAQAQMIEKMSGFEKTILRESKILDVDWNSLYY